jgi:hypothetical protein
MRKMIWWHEHTCTSHLRDLEDLKRRFADAELRLRDLARHIETLGFNFEKSIPAMLADDRFEIDDLTVYYYSHEYFSIVLSWNKEGSPPDDSIYSRFKIKKADLKKAILEFCMSQRKENPQATCVHCFESEYAEFQHDCRSHRRDQCHYCGEIKS